MARAVAVSLRVTVDRAEDGWALVSVQLLAHWNGHGISSPLAPWFLWCILEPTPPSALPFLAMKVLRSWHARAREFLWEELQARGTGWVRAIWVAAPRGVDRCLLGGSMIGDSMIDGGATTKIWATI